MTTAALALRKPTVSAAEWLRIGQDHHRSGRTDEAIAAYECGLAAAAGESAERRPATIAELHSHLGNAWMLRGDLERAADSFRAALRLAPGLTSCWCNLGNVHVRTGKPRDAVAFYLQALKTNPAHWASRTNLVQALITTRQFLIAKALLVELIGERPQDAAIHHQLGKVRYELNETESAVASFEQAIALDPGDADSLYWLGGIRQRQGEIEAARNAYAQAAAIQPLIRRPAIRSPADFRVLALYAPFGGNTPMEYLFKNATYDADTLALFESNTYDAEVFRPGVHVVVNLISDVDQGAAVLPLAADLVEALGQPTINHPRKILRTSRDAVADLLSGIPGCRIPKILRQTAGSALSPEEVRAVFPSVSTLLARPVGTHGGDDFEQVTPAELAACLAQPVETDRYLIEYVDYRSADGYFRKYRFIFVDDQILPYHLAIADGWKVHHVNTDMANQPWMQEEEAAFLSQPSSVFGAGHYRALQEIRRRIGLEYFGIDCSLDRSGNLVVFEVNASMLVHDDNSQFPYKDPAVRRIKSAFDAMLKKFAASAPAETGASAAPRVQTGFA
jgi:tetratricopeptide (TPR) repeat protein